MTGIPHLRPEIDDVHRPCTGYLHATEAHIRQLLEFLRDWRSPDRLLIHCWAGSSRSTAAALVAMAVRQPGREMEAAKMLRTKAPQARPNELMVRVADEVMGLEGRLVAAVAGMALNQSAQTVHDPFFNGFLKELLKERNLEGCSLLSGRLSAFLSSDPVRYRTDDDVSLVVATRRIYERPE